MTDLLTEYRDDGPLARMVRARPVPASSLILTLLAAAAAVAGLSLESTIGLASILGIVAFVILGTLGGAGRHQPRLQWLVPPLLHGGELGVIATVTSRAEPEALWLAYVLLAVIAFHLYDIVYRLRHQRKAPPTYVSVLGGGWEGRTLVVTAAAITGTLVPVLIVAAIWFGVLFMGESTRSWVALALDETRRSHVGTEVEEEEV